MSGPFDAGIDDELTLEGVEDDEYEALSGESEEWFEKYENRWYGRYVALVKDNNDPKKLGRLRVECPSVFGATLISPWCEPGMVGADSNQGLVWIPEKGAIVWIDFPEGELHEPDVAPNWTYGPWFDETTGIPSHAREEQDGSDTNVQTLKGRGTGFIPTSTYATVYPNWRGLYSTSGHMLEFDDTPNQERVQLYHKIGTFLEVTADGSLYMGAVSKMKAAAIGELRLAAMDATAALAGNEVGMMTTGGLFGPKGWLGQKTASTEPLVCGNLLVTYLLALHAAITGMTAALNTMGGALNTGFGALNLDPALSGTTKTAMNTAATAMTAAAGAMTAATAAINALPAVHFPPATPTSFLSDLWFTQKLGPFTPEA